MTGSSAVIHVPEKTTVVTSDELLLLDNDPVSGSLRRVKQTSLPYVRVKDGALPANNQLTIWSGSGAIKEITNAPGFTHNSTLGYSIAGAGTLYDLNATNTLFTNATITNGIITRITASGDISSSGLVTSLSASIDHVLVNDKLQGNGSGFQFFAFNEDTSTVKFANWYGSQDNQYGMGMLWYET